MADLSLGKPEKLDVELSLDDGRDGPRRKIEQRQIALTRFDYIYIGVLLLLLFPVYRLARLPFRIDLAGISEAYWGGTAVSAAFFAILLVLIGLPIDETLLPCLSRYREKKGRILIALVLMIWMAYVLGLWMGFVVSISALGVAELKDRRKGDFESALIDVFFPALYLFFVITLVYAFNHALAGIRYAGTYDGVFSHLDWLLFHVNVSHIAHWCLSHFPAWIFTLLELSYFGMYGRIGAVLILIALLGNQQYAVKYVRALLICYTIATAIFILCPVKGPYSICPVHLSSYPRWLPTFWTQETLLIKARALFAHHLTPDVSLTSIDDYYIGFPSLHTALPLIGIWFLRPWKRIAGVMLFLFLVLLVPALILLEWHYLVDVLGGVATAFLAIWITDRISTESLQNDLQKADLQ